MTGGRFSGGGTGFGGGVTTTGATTGFGAGLGGLPQPAIKTAAASKAAPQKENPGDWRVIALFLETRARLGEDNSCGSEHFRAPGRF
jgi:hypothetical protein